MKVSSPCYIQKVFHKLLHKQPDIKIAEIGVYKGYLAKNLLEHSKIKEYWAVDTWSLDNDLIGKIYNAKTRERWDKIYSSCCDLMVRFKSLKLLRMKSQEASLLFENGYFDLVFIDADHKYESVANDIKDWLPKVKQGGFLTGHDYDNKHPGVKKAVNEVFSDVTIINKVWIKEVA